MYKGKRVAKRALSYFFLIALAIVMLFPLVWLVFAPFKTNQQIFSSVSLFPDNFSFDAYVKGWKGTAGFTYTTFFANSFRLTIPVVLLTLVSSTLTGYGFARFRFRGKKFLKMVLISTLMLPGTTLVVPRYILFTRLGLTNSYAAFYVPAALGCTPFFTYQILQYFRGLPYELDESARIDGCNSFSLLLRILLPLCTPSLCAMGLFQFMWTWNDYFNVNIYINSISKYTVSQALRLTMDAESAFDWAPILAMSVLAISPCVLLFFFGQRYFVEGVATTGIKG